MPEKYFASPNNPPPITTNKTSALKKYSATKDKIAKLRAKMSVCEFGKITTAPNITARFKITPTTAAVTPESAWFNFSLWRNFSIYGAPAKIKKNDGKNVA